MNVGLSASNEEKNKCSIGQTISFIENECYFEFF